VYRYYYRVGSVAECRVRAGLRRRRAWVQIAAATLSGNSLRQTVHTHCASVHKAAKLVAVLLRVAGVTAGLAESNGSLPPGLWLTSPAGWLPRTGISSGILRSVIEYGLLFYYYRNQSVVSVTVLWRAVAKVHQQRWCRPNKNSYTAPIAHTKLQQSAYIAYFYSQRVFRLVVFLFRCRLGLESWDCWRSRALAHWTSEFRNYATV